MISKMARLRVRLVLALLPVILSAAPVRADDSGWFDEESSQSTAATPAPAPAAAPAQAPVEDPQDSDPRALTDFRPTLDPYGYWVQDPTYGLIWVPNRSVVGADFAPYVTSGHWALDEDGEWIWVSDYPFGGVVFHYGRWVWVGGYGWAWVPGYRYAPAWVVWRVPVGTYAYVGWAPLPPSYVWFGGVAVWGYYPAPYPYVFCPSGYVFHHHVHRYVVHDRVLIPRLAEQTRRYDAPANVRGVSRAPRDVESKSYRRSPTLSEARVFRSAPIERARSAPRILPNTAPPLRPGEQPRGAVQPSSFRTTPIQRATPIERSTMIQPNRAAPNAAVPRSSPPLVRSAPRQTIPSSAVIRRDTPVRTAPAPAARPPASSRSSAVVRSRSEFNMRPQRSASPPPAVRPQRPEYRIAPRRR